MANREQEIGRTVDLPRSPFDIGMSREDRDAINQRADRAPVTREAVEWGYRIILGRAPESEDVCARFIGKVTLAEMRGQLWTSAEFRKQFRQRLIGLEHGNPALDEPVSEEMIVWAYLLLLVRIPDHGEVAGKMPCATLGRLRDTLLTSDEFKTKYSCVAPPWQ